MDKLSHRLSCWTGSWTDVQDRGLLLPTSELACNFYCSTETTSVSQSALLGGSGALVKLYNNGRISMMLLWEICGLCKQYQSQWTLIHCLFVTGKQTHSFCVFFSSSAPDHARRVKQVGLCHHILRLVGGGMGAVCLSTVLCCFET